MDSITQRYIVARKAIRFVDRTIDRILIAKTAPY